MMEGQQLLRYFKGPLVQGFGHSRPKLLHLNGSKQPLQSCSTVRYVTTQTILSLSISGPEILNPWQALLRFALLKDASLSNLP